MRNVQKCNRTEWNCFHFCLSVRQCVSVRTQSERLLVSIMFCSSAMPFWLRPSPLQFGSVYIKTRLHAILLSLFAVKAYRVTRRCLVCRVSVRTGNTVAWRTFCWRRAKEDCTTCCMPHSVSPIKLNVSRCRNPATFKLSTLTSDASDSRFTNTVPGLNSVRLGVLRQIAWPCRIDNKQTST